MRRKAAILTGLLALALTAGARAPKTRTGVWDNITSIEETGDIVGTRVEVFDGLRPYVLARICEGECPPEALRSPAVIKGDTISFDYRMDSNPPDTLHVVGRFTRKGLVLKTYPDADEQLLPPAKPGE
ncbi:MAG TPA: hypothetical protein VN157_01190 [Caulobacter sp.]|nr:hypothetical protein [Caulobacter sp.]